MKWDCESGNFFVYVEAFGVVICRFMGYVGNMVYYLIEKWNI